jgi:hypothetical protein
VDRVAVVLVLLEQQLSVIKLEPMAELDLQHILHGVQLLQADKMLVAQDSSQAAVPVQVARAVQVAEQTQVDPEQQTQVAVAVTMPVAVQAVQELSSFVTQILCLMLHQRLVLQHFIQQVVTNTISLILVEA